MLTISVKNFGPIAEGSVDLKPLTIFMGPNNTGKSHMATMVYALLRLFSQPMCAEKGMGDTKSALDSELPRLFGPVRSLARGGDMGNILRIALERREPQLSVSYELPPDSSALRCRTSQPTSGWTPESLPPDCYYLPASRSWIVSAGKSASPPGVAADFARHWRQLASGKRRSVAGAESVVQVAEYLEKSVFLGGVVDVQIPSSPPRAEGLSLLLHHASSSVAELAPVILFLKYLVRPGDLLILEEPESHLHPAAQLQLARGIVRLVNAGVKVMITTHSDIIISQINNLLALRQASPGLISEGGFTPEDFLREDQVGAYLFRYNRELAGSEVVPLEIDPDTGIDEDEFATVFEAIYDESIALQRDRN